MSADEEGTLYLPDAADSRVLKINNHGHLMKSWPAPAKPLSADERPSWVQAEPDNVVFVAYFSTGRVEKFSSDGASSIVWVAAAGPAGEPSPMSGLAVNGEFVFTMAASSTQVRVWTLDGQHKLDADLGPHIGQIAAPQIAVTPHSDLLVLDPAAPKVFRFRIHLEQKEPQ